MLFFWKLHRERSEQIRARGRQRAPGGVGGVLRNEEGGVVRSKWGEQEKQSFESCLLLREWGRE